MHKQMLIRHLQVANVAAMRAIGAAEGKYGNNHLVTTTLKMEQKELSDYIAQLQQEEANFTTQKEKRS